MFETELQVEMTRYIELTKTWTGFHRYRIMSTWMGTIRMREMNDFLTKQIEEEAKLHSDDQNMGPRTA